MKTIIATTDFSPAANNAVNYAAGMATAINADLLLLNIVPAIVGYSDMPILPGLEDMMRSAENDMENLKEEVRRRTQTKIKIEAEVGMGDFFEQLKNVCERIKPYAVVMGSQDKTATEHLLLGEHAVHAARHLTWPVITVPPEMGFTTIKKIGLASNLTEVVENTPIDEITLIVNDFNAELHILNTGKQEVFDADIVFGSVQMQEKISALKPQIHFINNEDVDEGIIDFADKNKIDLLIVLPKHHNFIENIFHKSHTKQLVLHSHVPVMALHEV